MSKFKVGELYPILTHEGRFIKILSRTDREIEIHFYDGNTPESGNPARVSVKVDNDGVEYLGFEVWVNSYYVRAAPPSSSSQGPRVLVQEVCYPNKTEAGKSFSCYGSFCYLWDVAKVM